MKDRKEVLMATLSLFTSTGTLLCCALPALLVAIGAGAVVAGLVSDIPQLEWLLEHKTAIFIVAAILLFATGLLRFYNRNASCPIDREKAKACGRLRKISGVIYWSSVLIYIVGFFFSYVFVYFI